MDRTITIIDTPPALALWYMKWNVSTDTTGVLVEDLLALGELSFYKLDGISETDIMEVIDNNRHALALSNEALVDLFSIAVMVANDLVTKTLVNDIFYKIKYILKCTPTHIVIETNHVNKGIYHN